MISNVFARIPTFCPLLFSLPEFIYQSIIFHSSEQEQRSAAGPAAAERPRDDLEFHHALVERLVVVVVVVFWAYWKLRRRVATPRLPPPLSPRVRRLGKS